MQTLPSVSLYIRITEPNGKRRYERIKRGRNPQMCGPRDVYCLHFYQCAKRKWETVGTDLEAAVSARFKKESELAVRSKEAEAQPEPSPTAPKSLEGLRTAFIHDKKTTFKKDGFPLDADTITSYEKVTRAFLDITKRTLPGEITRQDLRDWIAKQRERVSHRTVCNLYVSIVCFLRFCDVDHKKLLPQSERPTPVEETPEAYTQEEITKFFFVITKERDVLAFEFLLKSGAREREMSHLEWTDLNLGPTPTVKFQTKKGFRTKTGKARVVPLERGLASRLSEWRVKNPATRYVFTTDDKIEGHFLRLCKAAATRAGMDPKDFWLHKFRDSFATWALRRGVDPRTVQHWLGHESLEMTMRYLSPQQGELAQGQINKAFNISFEISETVRV
ncbi:MAG: site-specific integrase [Candidatus Sulfotelmatobacter sp.]